MQQIDISLAEHVSTIMSHLLKIMLVSNNVRKQKSSSERTKTHTRMVNDCCIQYDCLQLAAHKC